MQATQQFDTKPLLRPRQVEEAKSEIKSMEDKLKNPHIEDKGEVMRQLNRVRKTFEAQVPRGPQTPDEEGRMVARSKQLLSEIIPAMCSQEEMRGAPPGAVDKFMMGENSPAMKAKILEWKNLQLRLKPGERESANLERHRPKTSTLNMDNAVVSTKMFFMPPVGAAQPVTFSDAQIAAIRALDPKMAEVLASLPNEARAEVKEIIGGIGLAEPTQAQKNGAKGVAIREAKKKWAQMNGAERKAYQAAKKAA